MISHRTTFSVFSEASDDIINDCIKNVKVLFCDDTLNICVIGILQVPDRELRTIFESRTACGAVPYAPLYVVFREKKVVYMAALQMCEFCALNIFQIWFIVNI